MKIRSRNQKEHLTHQKLIYRKDIVLYYLHGGGKIITRDGIDSSHV